MKKVIFFIFCFTFYTIHTLQKVAEFKKSSQKKSYFEQTLLHHRDFLENQNPQIVLPEVTPERWTSAIKQTSDKNIEETLNKYFLIALGDKDKDGILYQLAYKQKATEESERLKATIEKVLPERLWKRTTFTCTAPSFPLVVSAHEVLTGTANKFPQYFTRINAHTTKVKCPISKFMPVKLQAKVFHTILETINQHKYADVSSVTFWGEKKEDRSPLLITHSLF